MAIKQIMCSGTPYDIGYTHGKEAKAEIERAIVFYASLFMKNSKQTWPQVQGTARKFDNLISARWPRYYEELKGVADGAQRDILDIIALNVRTEIAFGLFSDGCTSLYWQDEHHAFLGQNWDWMEDQKPNLIHLTIIQDGLPTIKIMTEAGIIGKIGFNSSGVGVCFNAIRARGLDETRLPVHLGLRLVLESTSATEAVEKLESIGLASSAHMLIGDATTAIGLEFTSSTFARLPVDSSGRIIHSNHLLLPHPGVYESQWLADSPVRIAVMEKNTAAAAGQLSWPVFSRLFEDETNYPGSICRAREGSSTAATLFNIVMELREKKAVIRMGRPVKTEETIELGFEE
ncbi:hypothetical protein VTN77DRAFT_8688 [Rasamsonia byssochlamydoides]|uniref:uncharacterized protein n=1 Tax=Rasamsonia byssochlamydoides TaxID=89139 RepID=UPI003742E7BB